MAGIERKKEKGLPLEMGPYRVVTRKVNPCRAGERFYTTYVVQNTMGEDISFHGWFRTADIPTEVGGCGALEAVRSLIGKPLKQRAA